MAGSVQFTEFSVIVPTYNRPGALRDCLQSFTALNYPRDAWELIVVNDGGEHSFAAITEGLKQSLPLQLITVAHKGPARARNVGALQARGDYLAFTDDDCQVAPDWLTAFHHGYANGQCHALGGHSLTPFVQNQAEQAWQHLTEFLHGFMRDQCGNALLLLSNNASYRKDVFMSLRGFNESFPLAAAEDLELSYRLLAAGYCQRIIPDARIWHYHHLSTGGHLKQQFRYGRGGYYFEQTLAKRPSPRLRPLYLNAAFYPALYESMGQANLPFRVRTLIKLAQQAYKVGLRYQALRSRLLRRGGAVVN